MKNPRPPGLTRGFVLVGGGWMRFAMLGSGAVGGYFGALLAQSGQDVTFIARGAHRDAILASGLRIHSASLGDFTVHCPAEADTGRVGPVDVVVVAVKAYDNATAFPLITPLLGPDTVVLTLQNGVANVNEIAALAGEAGVLGGTTYVATALEAPGLIVQTGVHRSIIFGEVFGDTQRISPRVQAIAEVMERANILVTAVADARVPLWDKFVYLVPFSGFTGVARLPIGYVWSNASTREHFYAAAREVAAVAAAEGVTISPNRFELLTEYMDNLPPSTRSSLLIDLEFGKRIEVEALQGETMRRAARYGIEVPIVSTLYAALKPWESGNPKTRQTP